MNDTTKRRPAPKKIDPDRFAQLVQRVEHKKADLELADQEAQHAISKRNEVAEKLNEARDLLRLYIQECGGP